MRTLLITICLSLHALVSAHADVVFSTFGEGESHSTSGGYVIGKNAPDHPADFTVAMPFQVSRDVYLDDVRVAAHRAFAGTPNELSLTIYDTGVDGNPNHKLETMTIVNLADQFEVRSALSSLHPRLNAEKDYWLALSSEGVFSWSLSLWSKGTVGSSTDGGMSWSLLLPGPTTRYHSAFSVAGQLVPEPGTLILCSIVALAALSRLRR